jgi:staphyloferrin B biosynthesis citrate synthase
MKHLPRTTAFRSRLKSGARLLGTFVKTPHPVVIEVLSYSDLDCVCVDAEHAPFDRRDLDLAALAARAADMPLLVRIARQDAADVLNVLDLGATGVVIPHVLDATQAATMAAACRYAKASAALGAPNSRGYAGSARAADYTTRTMTDIIPKANAAICMIAQIEDAQALNHLDAIAAVEGVDALFVGRMDLTVSLGASSPNDPIVIDAVKQICAAGKRHGCHVGMFTTTTEEAQQWFDSASLFLLASEQQWILQGARQLRATFDQLK